MFFCIDKRYHCVNMLAKLREILPGLSKAVLRLVRSYRNSSLVWVNESLWIAIKPTHLAKMFAENKNCRKQRYLLDKQMKSFGKEFFQTGTNLS